MPKNQACYYDQKTVAHIREWVKHCDTWLEARSIIAEQLGVHPDNVSRGQKRFKFWSGDNRPPPPPSTPPPSGESRRAAALRNLVDAPFDAGVETSTAATMEEVVGLMKVDLDVWEPRGFSVTRKKNGFGWNARFARRPEAADRRVIEDLKRDIAAGSRVILPPIKRKPVKGGRLLVVSLFDAHLGKLSWAEQDGQSYDLKIAKECYLRALYDLIAKAKQYGAPISRILFPVGNDYLTCDSDVNETTAGTLQSVDGRFPKIYREGRKLLCESIEYLRTIAPVDVIVTPGNHDRNSMFHMGDALDCWFHDQPDVTVDNRWVPRKYYRFGNTVFGLTHGDTIRQDRLPLAGAVEADELWAQCKRRVWLLGHFHHFQLKEYMGVQVHILPSLSGSDGYHQNNGFIGALRTAVALLYSETEHEATFQSTPEN